jgi:hypothetical protein
MTTDATPAAWRRTLVLVALLALVACGHRFPSWRCGSDRAEGERLYLGACASCHGRDARGGGPDARELSVPPPDLTTLAARHEGRFPRQYVIDFVTGATEVPTHGTREMPVRSDRFGPGPGHVASAFARRQVELMADHLKALQR